ncbi:hypothetical protein Nepgr_031660 [Nepenthes gracilis]|uniref:ACT domain-containing protein ACR n=1 Tax=Nepenthes gracilis TaxID=150966 RepID=A0AAD3Y508_NEPGR|nr:hypothetical protein Nepgr_031660 [Nepenthes gracilis]
MNVFLYAPPLLLLLKALNISEMIWALIGATTVQILLGLPFFVSHPKAYITEADDLGCVFYFKLVPEPIFGSKFVASLLIVHLGLLLASAHYKWCTHERGIVKFWRVIYASMKLNQQLYTTSKALKNDHIHRLWQLGDELRGHPRVSDDHQWLLVTSKLAEQTKFKGERKPSVLTNSATTYFQLTITPVLEPSLEGDSTTLLPQNPLFLAVSFTIITALGSLLSTYVDVVIVPKGEVSCCSWVYSCNVVVEGRETIGDPEEGDSGSVLFGSREEIGQREGEIEEKMNLQTCSDEFEKLMFRMTTPRVVIDNAVCPSATLVKVDSARKHGILLEAVQVLTDLNLSIKKAYISSDGRWFMDVFHVTDLNGNKLTDESVISYMEQSLGSIHHARTNGNNGLTALELTGTDRIGLLSEVFAVLSDLNCNIVDAKVWTHRGRIASLIYLKDCDSGYQIEDSKRIRSIELRLRPVLKGYNDVNSAKMTFSMAVTHTERRLHQMMFDDGDHEREAMMTVQSDPASVTVQNWTQRGYSIVNVQCKDRMKLLFDVVCTLTDLDYAVFHATVNTEGNLAYLEFYIKHTDGTAIDSDAEMQILVRSIQAAIERRDSRGLRLQLCAEDRRGLLADVTRTFRENGLNITRAEISTSGDVAHNIFYVTDAEGYLADPKVIEAVKEKIGRCDLEVKELPSSLHREVERNDLGLGNCRAMLQSIGSLVRKNLHMLGLIRPYS